jgi:hypothetical protein
LKCERARLKCGVHESALAERHVIRDGFGLVENQVISNGRLVIGDCPQKFDLNIRYAQCRLIDDDCSISSRTVRKCDLPRSFSGAPIFYEVKNENVAEKGNDKCDDKMFGWVIALHLNNGLEHRNSETKLLQAEMTS